MRRFYHYLLALLFGALTNLPAALPASAARPLTDSLSDGQLKAFEQFLVETKVRQQKNFIYFREYTEPAIKEFEDYPLNGGNAFFSQNIDDVRKKVADFNKSNRAKIFVCTGRFYLPDGYFTSYESADLKTLAALAARQKGLVQKKAFVQVMNKHLEILEQAYPDDPKIVLFGFEFVWTSANSPFQTEVYSISHIAVDKALKTEANEYWHFDTKAFAFETSGANFNQDRSGWLRKSVNYITGQADAYINGIVPFTGVVAKRWVEIRNDNVPDSYLTRMVQKLGKDPENIDKPLSAPDKFVFDYAGVFDKDQEEEIEKNTTPAFPVKVICTDSRTPADKLRAIDAYLQRLDATTVVFWLNLSLEGKVQYIMYNQQGRLQEEDMRQLGGDLLGKLWNEPASTWERLHNRIVSPFRFLNVDLPRALAGLVGMAKIPEKYYVKGTGYDPSLYRVFLVTSAVTALSPHTLLMRGMLARAGLSAMVSNDVLYFSELEFAFTCGFWNGAMGFLQAIPSTAAGLANFIFKPNLQVITDFFEGIGRLMDKCAQDNPALVFLAYRPGGNVGMLYGKCMIDALIDHFKYCGNSEAGQRLACNDYQVAAKAGGLVFEVVSVFAPLAAGGKLAEVFAFLDRLEATNVLIRGIGLSLEASAKAYRFGKGLLVPALTRQGKMIFQLLNNAKTPILRTDPSISRGYLAFGNDAYEGYWWKPEQTDGPTGIREFMKDERGFVVDDEGYALAKLDNGEVALVRVGSKTVMNMSSLTGTAVRLREQVVAKLTGLRVNPNDQVIDLIVHAEGSRYFAYAENTSGRLGQRIELSTATLAGFVEQAGIANTTTIRLLSCSSLESAQALSRALGSRPLLATDGLVRVHDDGGITTVARTAGGDVGWYGLKNGVKTPTAHTPAAPGAEIKDKDGKFVQMGEEVTNHSGDGLIAIARKEFDNFSSEWKKINPHTGKEMFDNTTGGYVVVHNNHNIRLGDIDSEVEFRIAESFAKNGIKVKLLNEKLASGIVTPDAEVIGLGVFDFKNIATSATNIETNVMNKVLSSRRQGDNIAFYLGNNTNATSDRVNRGIQDAILTAMASATSLPKNIGVVYLDGSSKILSIEQLKNGSKF